MSTEPVISYSTAAPVLTRCRMISTQIQLGGTRKSTIACKHCYKKGKSATLPPICNDFRAETPEVFTPEDFQKTYRRLTEDLQKTYRRPPHIPKDLEKTYTFSKILIEDLQKTSTYSNRLIEDLQKTSTFSKRLIEDLYIFQKT
jgi:hypothetical protein